MPEALDLREPLLVNAIGHAAGTLIFGVLLMVLLRDTRLRAAPRGVLPPLAAFLAMLWNMCSLAALAGSVSGQWNTLLPAAIGFGSLSLLPAVLLAMSLDDEAVNVQRIGWFVGAAAVVMHVVEAVAGESRFHGTGLLAVTLGFAVLPGVAALKLRSQQKPLRRVLAPMALMLFAMSFGHFENSHAGHPWATELAVHHAGIPLALYIVLQDYRFLLLDVFLRALASGLLAGAVTLALVWTSTHWRLHEAAFANPLYAGLTIVGACCVLVGFAWLRGVVQCWVTRRVFRRVSIEEAIQQLVGSSAQPQSEEALLRKAADVVAAYAGARRAAVIDKADAAESALPDLATSFHRASVGDWVDAVVPLQFARGESKAIALGPRAGARRYLSEDFRELSRLAAVIVAQVERFRSEAVERLATKAELRALQAQINPHFLFNALNALYGSIPRSAEAARRTVLNLADMFRYFLQNDRSLIALSEELRIIRAYLEVEQLRLGDRLRTEIDVDESLAAVHVPPLSIQPLVENAVKHGVARRTESGYVVLRIRHAAEGLQVEVRDSGGSFLPPTDSACGVGLENVRQRLKLTYGPQATVQIATEDCETVVSFEVPVQDAARSQLRLPATTVR